MEFRVETLDSSCPADANYANWGMNKAEIAKLLVKSVQGKNDYYAIKIGNWFLTKKLDGTWFSPEWDHRFDFMLY